MTLRSYLAVLTLAALLPVAILAAVIGGFLLEEQRATFRRGAEERTLAMLTAVDSHLRGSLSMVQALAVAPSLVEGDLDDFRRVAASVLASQPDWVTINVALPNGEQVLNLRAPEGAPLPRIADIEGALDTLVRERRAVVSDLVIGPVTNKWDFAVRAPVVRGGTAVYVVSAVVNPDSIQRLIGAQGLPADWVGVVLDRNNRIVARSVEPEKTRGRLASQSLQEGLARAASGWFRGSTIEGTPVYTPYRRSPVTGWAFAMGIPAAAVNAGAAKAVTLLVIGLVGTLLLALLLAVLVGRRISRPIAALARATEAMGRGGRVEIPVSARVAELRPLESALRAAVRSQEALTRAEEQMRSVVDHAIDGIVTIDEAGTVQTFNRAAEKLFGYRSADIVGRSVQTLMPERYRAPHEQGLARYLRTGEARIIGIGREVEGRRKDGSTFPMDIAVSEFRVGAQRLFTGIVRDITERKRAELALKEADRAKDEFLAMLGHELRNPLAALTTASHVLRAAQPADPAAAQARGVIERQTHHMVRLVEDLLDISRVTMGKLTLEPQLFNLAELVSTTVEAWRLAGRLEKRGRVTVETSAVWVKADRARIEQVFSNLLDNAVKFTPTGGAIDIRVRAAGQSAILRVADTGRGLPSDARERIFEPFVQGEQPLGRGEGGLGIGLALVKRLTELHGGTVRAESEGPGKGAAFTVSLPARAAPAASAAPPLQAQPSPGRRRVLVIEDNDDARQMLVAALALRGHEVREAASGAAGLAAAKDAWPDIALVDIGLPDIDGYEVARRLRNGGRLRLIAITGYGQAQDENRARAAGFDAHLVKPVSVERLEHIMAELK